MQDTDHRNSNLENGESRIGHLFLRPPMPGFPVGELILYLLSDDRDAGAD